MEVIFSCITPNTPSHFFPSRYSFSTSRFPSHPHTHLTLIPSPILSSPHPIHLPFPCPSLSLLPFYLPYSPLRSNLTHHTSHTPNYPSTFQPNPTSHSPSISHPIFPYFPSLPTIPGSHFPSPYISPITNRLPLSSPSYLILTIILTCLQVKISSLTHTCPHSYPQVIHIFTFSLLTLILSIIPLKPLLSLSYCVPIRLNTLNLT